MFYPCDKEEYNRRIEHDNPLWACHGNDTLIGIAKAAEAYDTKHHKPAWIFRFLSKIKINVGFGAEISRDFI